MSYQDEELELHCGWTIHEHHSGPGERRYAVYSPDEMATGTIEQCRDRWSLSLDGLTRKQLDRIFQALQLGAVADDAMARAMAEAAGYG